MPTYKKIPTLAQSRIAQLSALLGDQLPDHDAAVQHGSPATGHVAGLTVMNPQLVNPSEHNSYSPGQLAAQPWVPTC